jgi:tetratricopeptide (TPR) repeat protein
MQMRSFVIGLLVGAAVVAATWIGAGLARSQDPGPVESGAVEHPDRLPPPDAGWDALAVRLEAIATRLEAGLAGRVATDAPTLRGHPDAAADDGGGAARPTFDAEALVDALEKVEVRREAKLTNDELIALARRRLYTDKDYVRARRSLELLLSRDLEPEERVRAQTQLGITHRSLGDHESSIEVLREALDASSVDEGPGVEAAFQLMWSHKYAGDNASAARVGEQIVRGKHGQKITLVVTHRTLGMIAKEEGDLAQARRELETSLRLAGNDPTMAQQRVYTQQMLDALE